MELGQSGTDVGRAALFGQTGTTPQPPSPLGGPRLSPARHLRGFLDLCGKRSCVMQ